MKTDLKLKTVQVAVCLVCVVLVWNYGSGLGGTEFSGGRVTGRLLDMEDVGTLLFIPTLLLTFFFRRIAAAMTIVASLLCLPLYLYFTAPGPFRFVMRGQYSVPLQDSFVWNRWSLLGLCMLILAAYVGVRGLVMRDGRPN